VKKRYRNILLLIVSVFIVIVLCRSCWTDGYYSDVDSAAETVGAATSENEAYSEIYYSEELSEDQRSAIIASLVERGELDPGFLEAEPLAAHYYNLIDSVDSLGFCLENDTISDHVLNVIMGLTQNQVETIFDKFVCPRIPDHRLDIIYRSNERIFEIASSIGILVRKTSIFKSKKPGHFGYHQVQYKDVDAGLTDPFCWDLSDRYHNRKAFKGARCTVFVTGEYELSTACHCFDANHEFDDLYAIFGYYVNDELKEPETILTKNIYEISSISKCKNEIITIKTRKPIIQAELKIDSSHAFNRANTYVTMGHPRGLPLVVVNNGKFHSNSGPESARLSIFADEGLSGAPLIESKSRDVVGVLNNKNPPYYRVLQGRPPCSCRGHDNLNGSTKVQKIL